MTSPSQWRQLRYVLDNELFLRLSTPQDPEYFQLELRLSHLDQERLNNASKIVVKSQNKI